ncbi:MAG TPA: class I SAM-dependent methyltransferase [Candidatus Yonathbacteria bacterium]|nr:class I SAM-dependent methyltransferase [Candidatus Yonathbacteria bacterium]
MNSTQEIYEKHHAEKKRENFSIMETERGEFFKDAVGQNKKVLDIGCRDGVLTRYFSEGNEVLGVDIDRELLLKAKENLEIETKVMDLNGDWNEIEGNKFDVITAGEIVEHLYYPEVVLEKIYGHLKNSGLFVGSVPNAFSLKHRLRYLAGKKKNTPLEDPTHINHFSAKHLKELLSRRFVKVEIVGFGRYKKLAEYFPSLFAFDLVFKCKKNSRLQ